MTSIPERIELVVKDTKTLNGWACEYHYMHRPVHARACPFGWAVIWDGSEVMSDGTPAGFIMFASIHYTKLKNEFGYEGLPTKWQVLSLARLWLHDDLPRNSETVVVAKALKMVQRRWLEVHPPRFPEQPYHIVKIISYSDTRYHQGTIYKASNFRVYGETKSARRHKNTRGIGMDGAKLICFVRDLKQPRWTWEDMNNERSLF